MPHAHPHIFPGSPAPTPNPFHPDPGEKGGGAQDGMYTNRQAEYNAGVTATVTTARLQRTLLLLSMYDPTNVGLASLSSADMASQLKLAFKSAKGALGRQQRVLTKPMRTTTQVGTLQGAVVLGRGGGGGLQQTVFYGSEAQSVCDFSDDEIRSLAINMPAHCKGMVWRWECPNCLQQLLHPCKTPPSYCACHLRSPSAAWRTRGWCSPGPFQAQLCFLSPFLTLYTSRVFTNPSRY